VEANIVLAASSILLCSNVNSVDKGVDIPIGCVRPSTCGLILNKSK
jgi:hypothetical protein